mmetsp:Transcript_30439/g.50233  ORF Transcript_30439/g.50233 Transcript_30439/m.50233 type:complete len:118 (-) Transcript_30439:467-820(-)
MDRGALWELDFFEGIQIPALYYPWASLLLWHMVDPENERGTLMHLAGLLVGLLHVEGYLAWILAPAVIVVVKSDKTDEIKTKHKKEETVVLAQKPPPPPPATPDPISVREARLKRFH